MRNRHTLARACALVAGGIAFVTATSAQQAPAPTQTTTVSPANTAPVSPPVATPAEPQPPASAKPPAAGASRGSTGGQSPEHFEPTEKVRADFDVSFPVDI